MRSSPPSPRSSRALIHVVGALMLLAAGCAPAAVPAPTAAPKPTEAPKPAAPAAPAASPVAAPAAQPAASPAAAAPAAAPAASPAAAAKAVSLPKPEKTSVKLAHSTLETSQLAYAVANEAGLYKKYGFDNVELLFAEGDGKAVQVLVSGGVDLMAGGVSAVISSQVTDAPMTTVGMTATVLTDAIVSVGDVKSAADLKGKTVAISTFGSTAHGAAVMGLKALNLTPNDVTLVQVGGQSSRIAAVKGGSVAAAVVDVALEDEMKSQGFNILTRLPDSPLEFGRNGLNFRRDWIQQYPNTVLAFTAAALEGQNLIWTDTEKAVDAYMKWAQIQDRAKAKGEVEAFLKYGNRDMRWTKEGWELARDILATSNPAVKDVDVTQSYTFQFLDRLKELGLNDALGIPSRGR